MKFKKNGKSARDLLASGAFFARIVNDLETMPWVLHVSVQQKRLGRLWVEGRFFASGRKRKGCRAGAFGYGGAFLWYHRAICTFVKILLRNAAFVIFAKNSTNYLDYLREAAIPAILTRHAGWKNGAGKRQIIARERGAAVFCREQRCINTTFFCENSCNEYPYTKRKFPSTFMVDADYKMRSNHFKYRGNNK